MKYPGGNTSTLFCEQVGTVTSLFEQWNDCERTVVLYALLKRVPFANLKFLQLSIEYNITQNYNSQTKLQILENNSNNAVFLTKLINTYKNFKCNEAQLNGKETALMYDTTGTQPAYLSGVDGPGAAHCKYDKKEDILNDILTYLPLLKPGNEDAKAVFLSLIPSAVDDSVRQIVPMELVQQILSYLLIHPAISNEDRRSLSQWLRHLEDHISLSYVPNKAPNYFLIPSDSSSSPSSSSSISTTSWQAVAPPHQQQKISTSNDSSTWDLKNIQVTQDFCDDIKMKEFRKVVGQNLEFSTTTKPMESTGGGGGSINQTSNQNLISGGQSTSPPSAGGGGAFDTSMNDDHHISFSKNGTEILDYDCDDYNKCNTQIAFDLTSSSSTSNFNDFLTVPIFENSMLKTRRSNSLTTAATIISPTVCTSSSSENLASILQKPRSFSLSMENTRLSSSGSETRLDDYKPNLMKFSTYNVGMGNIGQWLKSLRLHKYIWLFTNITYEQMLDINEAYLESVGVTKGARNKLVLCIHKLKDRVKILTQYKKEILSGGANLNAILEDVLGMVLTPMKPIDPYGKDDVAGAMLHVIDLIGKIITSRPIVSQNDEDCITNFSSVLDRALHSEGFIAAIDNNLIKEHKFKISKIKLQFTPKNHYTKNVSGNGGGMNKSRWNSSAQHKPHKSMSADKIQRKNSNFSSLNIAQQSHLAQFQQHYQEQQQSHQQKQPNLYASQNSSTNYNKSSSYPNFNTTNNQMANTNSSNCTSNSSSCSNNSTSSSAATTTTNKTVELHQHSTNSTAATTPSSSSTSSSAVANNYHRHSLNNLISTTMLAHLQSQPHISTTGSNNNNNCNQNNSTNLMSINNKENHRSSSNDGGHGFTTLNSSSSSNNMGKVTGASSVQGQKNSQKSSIGDINSINSRLEFLCLQMTEQAIN